MRLAMYIGSDGYCEDLTHRIRQAFMAGSVSFMLRRYRSERDLLYDIQDGEHPDVLFLQIDDDPQGLRLLEQLRCFGYEGDIVLLACTSAHAVNGYEWGALDFWLMPPDEARVTKRLSQLALRAHPCCLTVRRHGQVNRIPYAEVLFAESRNAKCLIHRVGGEEYVVYCKLDEIESKLADDRFIRCHQSYLVNMDHVVSMDHHFVLDDGRTAAVRQRELRRIREQYLQYLERRDKPSYESRRAHDDSFVKKL